MGHENWAPDQLRLEKAQGVKRFASSKRALCELPYTPFRKSPPMRAFSLLVAVAFVASTRMMHVATAADHQTVHAFQHSVTKTLGYKYLLALPDDYKATPEKRWPVLLFLHGSGERGDDVWSVAKHGPPKLLREDMTSSAAELLRKNFIVVSPQCPKGKWWDSETLIALLDQIAATQRVDSRRVYVTGMSMGGFGAWELGLQHPERFAAILPVCGGGSFPAAYQANTSKRSELRSLGVWAFHGAKDESVPLAESQRMVDMLKAMKVAEVKLTVFPEAKHDSWTATYANPEIYTWLLQHERKVTAN
jgi:predicted peptidase